MVKVDNNHTSTIQLFVARNEFFELCAGVGPNYTSSRLFFPRIPQQYLKVTKKKNRKTSLLNIAVF